ncbi:MAG: SPOR domain-containing protein, partial [Gammaproteobacteria bacterium]
EREPQEPAGLAEPEVSTAAPGGWSVQVGSFGEVANANQLVTRLSTFGYSASVSEFRSGGAMMYRVRVRGLESEGDAEVAASALSARGIPVQVIPPE